VVASDDDGDASLVWQVEAYHKGWDGVWSVQVRIRGQEEGLGTWLGDNGSAW
jgi:hypothetical protein